ncbi:hypothetical protein LEP1GSC050_2044 [Leptospira broomii serovar Hurstbridge str. 5399]|uniref:Uncharacterized protein n=1 Tax=Leptospira broomii serovar Hurstbridge str. 5399 TaxID=1049789 RepID=T0F9F1_9LEPT|nr:hypothetical protein LEP1GSC050_2044 [Leptospira broomii serovar Hurstbridge str. 5399]
MISGFSNRFLLPVGLFSNIFHLVRGLSIHSPEKAIYPSTDLPLMDKHT